MITARPLVEPLTPRLPRPTAMQLAATEYERVVGLLRSLGPEHWSASTECPGWDVRAMAAHMLGMVEMAASVRDQMRQVRIARRRGGLFIDELTALQVEEREGMTPVQIVEQYATRAPKAVAGRRRTPGFIRRRPMPVTQRVNGRDEEWSIGFLLDTILTRDPWMHRIDIVRATGATHVLTSEHDGVIVADVVEEWAARHGQPCVLHLTGPAGGSWTVVGGGPAIELDAVEFCRAITGRAAGDGLLRTEVPF